MRASAVRSGVVCLAVLVAACSGGGSNGEGSGNAGNSGVGGSGSGVAGDGAIGGAAGDNPMGGSGGGSLIDNGGASGGGGCEPATCEEQGKSCGVIADGCGSTLDCGGCGDDQVCGLALANVCAGIEDVCVRVSEEVACAGKQCGVEGDGCGGTLDCGTCAEGQACGLEAAYQCAPIPGGSPEECAARIQSCAEVGAECGVIGNGCGGTIDCDAETGGCGTGELCGNDPEQPLTCAPYDACVPLTAEQACTATCGEVGDGCGGTYSCEVEGFGCTGGDTCGGGGVPFECGQEDDYSCEPLDDAEACDGRECGYVGDGCGTAIDCSGGDGCDSNSQCQSGQCVEITPGCTLTPKATACAGKECGTVGDSCGGTYTCGDNGGACTGGEQCGALTAYLCDVPPQDPDDPGCVGRPKAEACAGKECGIAYNGCGTDTENTFDCGDNDGACPSGQFCGAQAAYQCDPLPTPPTCVPNGQTCESEEWACGTFIDNCGNTENCGTCDSNETCMGGINGPTTCQSVAGNGDEDCPLCNAVPTTCGSSELTRLTGRVITPGRSTDSGGANEVGVPNAFVYILRTNDLDDLPAIPAGFGDDETGCDRCADQELGPVLVGDVTDPSGEFVLEGNIPVEQEFLLVTKIGKFRRAERMILTDDAACETTPLPVTMATGNPTHLPRDLGEDDEDGLGINIPKIAVSTGRIDAMECVFEKMGIASTQFTRPQLGGRIHLYRADGAWPDAQSKACNDCTNSTCRTDNCGGPNSSDRTAFLDAVSDASLYGSLSRMNDYDMVVFDCEGGGWDQSGTQRGSGADGTGGGNVRQYANRGGRMFLSHLSFSWLYQNGTTAYSAGNPFATGLGQTDRGWDTAYTANGNLDDDGTGVISITGTPARQASPRIQTFADWMVNEAVTSAPGYTFDITDPRSLNTSLADEDEEFVYRSGGNDRTQQFSFNTPYGAPADAACGRIAYSGFHVAATGGSNQPFQNEVFPNHCAGDLTAQEKVLLFMLFDLGTCVGEEPEAPECTPLECDETQCGTVPDGCGGTLDCGEVCPDGQVCDGNLCRVECVKTTCEAEGIACSTIADGCGGAIECDCNACVPDDAGDVCVGGACGFQSDGCAGVVDCGDCPTSCIPETECPPGVCGTIGDGCNGTIACDDPCPTGEVCGAAGANLCGTPECQPLECYDLIDRFGIECGLVGDGCGQTTNCGSCPPGQICTVVDGQPNRCAGCVPKTQQEACDNAANDLECGLVGDGCGGTLDCGACPSGEYCGALTPNMCDPGPQCTPQACPSSAECGVMGDGCGGSVSCGTCPTGQLCGVYEPYQCGGCTPQTCESAGAQCGKIGDGCGNELDCGQCAPSFICGLGQANKCAQLR